MRRTTILLGLLVAAGCASRGELPDVARIEAPQRILSYGTGPMDAVPGTCWGRDEIPASAETVAVDVEVEPAILEPDGQIRTPSVVRAEAWKTIIEDPREIWFETPCPDALTPDVVASLQRALAVRGHFGEEVSGELDTATRDAIRRYQRPLGLDSSVLSLVAARRLGLAAIESHKPGNSNP